MSFRLFIETIEEIFNCVEKYTESFNIFLQSLSNELQLKIHRTLEALFLAHIMDKNVAIFSINLISFLVIATHNIQVPVLQVCWIFYSSSVCDQITHLRSHNSHQKPRVIFFPLFYYSNFTTPDDGSMNRTQILVDFFILLMQITFRTGSSRNINLNFFYRIIIDLEDIEVDEIFQLFGRLQSLLFFTKKNQNRQNLISKNEGY